MKLSIKNSNIELSSDMESKSFSIGDEALVLDILRSKLYSNPILAICREISCNARDSHVEAGKENEPIQITLPTTLDPNFRVRDFGVGISPERIESIFVKYGASTKRNDNKQVGAFGCGAKVPWSYSQEFTVESIYSGEKRTYLCVIDESRLGKLIKLGEEKTQDRNGCEIVVPVKSKDFLLFKQGVEQISRFWSIKPIIKNGTITWKDIKPDFKGTDWAVETSKDYYYNREIKLIIDGIEYPLDLNELKKYNATKLLDAIQGTIYLYFGNGELSLSASREAVHLDKETQDKIATKLEEVCESFVKTVREKIDSQKSLWEANNYFHCGALKLDRSLIKDPTWQGIPLSKDINFKIPDLTCGYYFSNYNKNVVFYSNTGINFYAKSEPLIFFNDLNLSAQDFSDPKYKVSLLKLKNLAQSKSDSYVYVFSLNDKKKWKDIDQEFYIKHYGFKLLSEHLKENDIPDAEPAKVVPAPTIKSRLNIFKFDPKTLFFGMTSLDRVKDDKNKKMVVFIRDDYYRRTKIAHHENGNSIDEYVLQALLNQNPGYSIYGVSKSVEKERIDKAFGKYTSYQDLKKSTEDKLKKNDMTYMAYLNTMKIKDLAKSFNSKILKNLDKNSEYLQAYNIDESIDFWNKHEQDYEDWRMLGNYPKNSEISDWQDKNKDKLIKSNKDLTKKYPMLAYFGDLFMTDSNTQKDLINYINMIDRNGK